MATLCGMLSKASSLKCVVCYCDAYHGRNVLVSGCYHMVARYKSSPVIPTESAVSTEGTSPTPRDALDLTFENTKNAYKSKTTWELFRAFCVLKLSSFNYLVENHQQCMNLGRKILGPGLFRLVMKHTFYGHFVAGENEVAIKPVLDRLRSFGVKSILDYSAEEDISAEQATDAEMSSCQPTKDRPPAEGELKRYRSYREFADRRKPHVMVRTYFYMNEAQCEKNMGTFLRCIDAVADATYGTGFAAIKLTALGRPQLLLQLSEVIARTRHYFKEVTGAEKSMALASVTPSALEHKLDRYHIKTDSEEVRKWLARMDYDAKGLMNLFSWSGLVDMNYVISDLFKVPSVQSGRMEPIINALTSEEEEMFRNMMRRIHHIAKVARDCNVRVMVDAEQTYFQPAINRITMELMRKYNKEKAIIFNTYQCYLKSAYDNVVLDLELAKRQNIYFGAKLVRGAYMEQERLRAQEVGYEDPINASYQATSDMYQKTLTEILDRIHQNRDGKIAIMVASHNEDTVRFTVKKMEEFNIKPEHKVVCFGQLYGMSDQISFTLGQSGYSVYKYVPYGPVDEVLPYLSRRAQENNSILTKVGRECVLLKTELKRRLYSGQIIHKPKGNYQPV